MTHDYVRRRISGTILLIMLLCSSVLLLLTVQNATASPGIGYWIIVAGSISGTDPLQCCINYGCNEVFKILRKVGYSGNRIYYMNQPGYENQDVDGDGQNDIDAVSSSANLQSAIETWASTDRCGPTESLFLYLFDHGGYEVFCIAPGDTVSSNSLDSSLNTLEGATNAPVHVIYAACHSGSFINNDDGSISGSKRVIVCSCLEEQGSYVCPGHSPTCWAPPCWECFSLPFWREIESGHSVRWSFNRACEAIEEEGLPQVPILDDNGDKTGHTDPLPNGGDGYVAAGVYVGSTWSWVFPWIQFVIAKLFYTWPPPPTVTLWARVQNETSLVHVRAWMKPPDWTPPTPDSELLDPGFECYEMTDPDYDGKFTVDIPRADFENHATGPSDFKFVITVEEENGMTAIPLATGVGFTATGQPPDDNTVPRVCIERPVEDRVVKGAIQIKGFAADNVCLDRVELYINGDYKQTIDLSPTSNSFFDFSFDTTTVSDGPTTIMVKAFDTSANWGAQAFGVIVKNQEGVGGIVVPVDKLGLLAPYIGVASTILVATVATAIYVKRVKRRETKNA